MLQTFAELAPGLARVIRGGGPVGARISGDTIDAGSCKKTHGAHTGRWVCRASTQKHHFAAE